MSEKKLVRMINLVKIESEIREEAGKRSLIYI